MLTKPNSRALRAFYSLSNRTGWDDISAFLDEELAAVYEQLSQAREEVTLRQLQGRAQFIVDFKKVVRDAPTLLEKLRETTL